jgi:hypothetical protein
VVKNSLDRDVKWGIIAPLLLAARWPGVAPW